MPVTLTERPLMTRAELKATAETFGGVSDRIFRRWQQEGLLTRGVTLRPREGGHAAGSLVLFSSLNRDALAFHRQGDAAAARDLREQAGRLEAEFERAVRGDWARAKALPWAADPSRAFADHWPELAVELLRRTGEYRSSRREFREVLGLLLRAGTVSVVHGAFARVRSGDEDLLVPRADLERSGLDFEGAEVLVRTENLRWGRLTSVEPALRVYLEALPSAPAKQDAPVGAPWLQQWVSHTAGADRSEGGDGDGATAGEPLPLLLNIARTPPSDEGRRRLDDLLGRGVKVRVTAPLRVA
jgi:hypothetical protein